MIETYNIIDFFYFQAMANLTVNADKSMPPLIPVTQTTSCIPHQKPSVQEKEQVHTLCLFC